MLLFLMTDSFPLISLSKISHVKSLDRLFQRHLDRSEDSRLEEAVIKVKDQIMTRKVQTKVISS